MSLQPGTLEILAATPRAVRALLAAQPAPVVEAPDPGGWSARDLIAHLVDRGRIQRARVERLIAAPGADIEDIDEHASLEASGLRQGALDALLATLDEERSADVARYGALAEGALAITGVHSVAGEITVAHLIHQAAYHDTTHIAQIANALGTSPGAGRGPFAMLG